jgi:hypothetical protein
MTSSRRKQMYKAPLAAPQSHKTISIPKKQNMKFSTAFFTTISANTIFTNAAPRSVHPGASNLFNILTFKANAAGFGDIDIEDLLKYGCHCNIFDGLEKGVGKPVDSVDR